MSTFMRKRDERLLILESWVDEYSRRVWAAIQLFNGFESSPAHLYEDTFVVTLKNYSIVRRYPSPLDSLVHAAVQECRRQSAESDTLHDVPCEVAIESEASATETPMLAAADIDAVRRLSVNERVVAIGYLLGDGNMEHLSRTLLLPRKVLMRSLNEVTRQMWPAAGNFVEGMQEWIDLRTRISTYCDHLCVPSPTVVRVKKVLKATQGQIDAGERHRGPRWTLLATFSLTVVAIGAVAYGMSRGNQSSSAESAITFKAQGVTLPKPIGNFPGRILSQLELPSGALSLPLQKAVITGDGVYLPTLKVATDTWPSIHVDKCELSYSGEALQDHIQSVASVDLIPPSRGAKDGKPGTNASTGNTFSISNWNYYVTNSWGVVVARWTPQNSSAETVTQLYVVYLPTGKSGLVQTIDGQNPQDTTVVAVGDGKVIEQSSVESAEVQGGSSSGSNSSVVTLPLDVYALSGTDPLQALGQPKHIPAPFGLMEKPTITGGTLVFQGIHGEEKATTGNNGIWYTLSWDGHLTTYEGAPIDGQPHWAVRAASGTLWWVETTPDETNKQALQVLMSPLGADGETIRTPATTLADSVRLLSVSSQYVAWVQDTEGVTQFVVGELQ